jgi:hypothetical protein
VSNSRSRAGADSTAKFSRRQPDTTTPEDAKAQAVKNAAEQELSTVSSGGGWKGALGRLNGKGEESFQKLSGKARRAVLSG